MHPDKTIKKQHENYHYFSQKREPKWSPKASPGEDHFANVGSPASPRPLQDTKHVERPPKTPKYHQKVTNRSKKNTKK
jgi:hypothetical protein